jgi:hypothetical protein
MLIMNRETSKEELASADGFALRQSGENAEAVCGSADMKCG